MKTRREILSAGVSGIAIATLPITLFAAPVPLRASIQRYFGDRPVTEGRVSLTLPPLAENGNSVSVAIDVTSPMTPADHVTTIHVLSEVNPLPDVAIFRLTPACGSARVNTRIRLADTQTIVAIATMSDGSLWSAGAETIVTLAACIDVI